MNIELLLKNHAFEQIRDRLFINNPDKTVDDILKSLNTCGEQAKMGEYKFTNSYAIYLPQIQGIFIGSKRDNDGEIVDALKDNQYIGITFYRGMQPKGLGNPVNIRFKDYYKEIK